MAFWYAEEAERGPWAGAGFRNRPLIPTPLWISAGMRGKQLKGSIAPLPSEEGLKEDWLGGNSGGGDMSPPSPPLEIEPQVGRASQKTHISCSSLKATPPHPVCEDSKLNKHSKADSLIGCVYIYMAHFKAMATLVIHIRNHKKS